MTDTAAMLALAERLCTAIETADVDTLKKLYAPNAEIWMNTTNRAMPARDVTAFLPHLAKKVANRRYVDRQVRAFDDGFVQRHRLIGTRNDGATVSVLACIVCTVENGLVTRVEEYCDSAQLKSFLG